MKLQRLDKIIANNSFYSRSQVSKLARLGLIYVNQEPITNPATKFSIDDIVITIDGEILSLTSNESLAIVFNKPAGYVCANEDGMNLTVFHLLPTKYRNFHCVGRLDMDTTGLLILTNDGNFSHSLTSPKKHVAKTYRVILADPIESNYERAFIDGIQLRGEKNPCLPAKLTLTDNPYQVYLTITEGKYHQVKRMFAALGNKVVNLHRHAVGEFELPSDIAEQEYIEYPTKELLDLILGQ